MFHSHSGKVSKKVSKYICRAPLITSESEVLKFFTDMSCVPPNEAVKLDSLR